MNNKANIQGWKSSRIDQLAKVKSGTTPQSDIPEYWDGDIVWITPDDLSSRSKKMGSSRRKISKLGLMRTGLSTIKPNSIAISSRAPVGYVSIVTTAFTTNQGCKSLESIKGDVDFFYYLLQTVVPEMQRLSNGTTFQEISKTQLEKIQLSYPDSVNEQEKIASILSNVDLSIEKSEQLINKYKSIKQGLIQDLFRYGIDEKGQIRSEKTHKFKDSPLGRIPDDWNVSNIGTSYLKGRIGWQGLTTKEYLEDGQYLLVTGTDFDNGRIKWTTCHYVESKRYSQDPNIQLRNGDVLVTKDGTIGKIAYVDNIPLPTTLNSGVFVVRPINKEYIPKYLYYVLRSFYFDTFIENLSAGSTIKHLYQKDFVKFVFPLPTPTEQNEIIKVLEAQDQAIDFEEQNLSKLIHLKQGLMQDLLTGKVRVNHLLN